MVDEPLIAGRITPVIRVLATVDFDDEPLPSTDKIYDIRTDRLLADEFETAERSGAQVVPKLSFSARRVFPQLAS